MCNNKTNKKTSHICYKRQGCKKKKSEFKGWTLLWTWKEITLCRGALFHSLSVIAENPGSPLPKASSTSLRIPVWVPDQPCMRLILQYAMEIDDSVWLFGKKFLDLTARCLCPPLVHFIFGNIWWSRDVSLEILQYGCWKASNCTGTLLLWY